MGPVEADQLHREEEGQSDQHRQHEGRPLEKAPPPASEKEPETDAEKTRQEDEVRDVGQPNVVGRRPPDQRQLHEQHEHAERNETQRTSRRFKIPRTVRRRRQRAAGSGSGAASAIDDAQVRLSRTRHPGDVSPRRPHSVGDASGRHGGSYVKGALTISGSPLNLLERQQGSLARLRLGPFEFESETADHGCVERLAAH